MLGRWGEPVKGVRPEVADLIDRMVNGEKYVPYPLPNGVISLTNDGSESWNATRRAEKLDDPAIAEELRPHLTDKVKVPTHQAVCFIIGRIGRNTDDPRCAEILIDRLRTAKRLHDLGNALGALANLRKPASLDIGPIIALLGHRRSIIVSQAAQALDGAEHPEAEDALLALTTDNRYVRPTINSVLGRIGTPKSLPMLEACLKSRTIDTRGSAEFAIDAIRSRFPTTA